MKLRFDVTARFTAAVQKADVRDPLYSRFNRLLDGCGGGAPRAVPGRTQVDVDFVDDLNTLNTLTAHLGADTELAKHILNYTILP